MRASISAALDGELSEFESIRLRTHVNACESCRAFEASAQLSATTLRAAPLALPSKQIAVPSRRRSVLQLRVPAAAAAVAVLMIGAGGVFEATHSGTAIPGSRPNGGSLNDQDLRALRLAGPARAAAQLRVRQAQTQSSVIPRHPGPQGQ